MGKSTKSFDWAKIFSRQLPMLASKGDIGPVLMLAAGSADYEDGFFTSEYTTLQADDELKAVFAEGYRNSRHAKRIFDNAREAAEQVLEEIEEVGLRP